MTFIEQHTDFYLKFLERLVHLSNFHRVMIPELGSYVKEYSKWLKQVEISGRADFYEFVRTFQPVLTIPVGENVPDIYQGLTLHSVTTFTTYSLQLLFIKTLVCPR